MKALLHTAPYTLTYTDVEDPVPGPGEVLIRIAACGICGSDVKGYTGTTGRRIPPIIMGHEAAGTIAAVGPEMSRWQVGDRVCFDSTVYCGTCEACRTGQVNRCVHRQVLGVSVPSFRRHGAFAEYLALPAHLLLPLPEAVSFAQAALLEPAAIGLHAVRRAGALDGATVAVIGAGPIGLFILQAARLAGAERLFVADLQPGRLALARRLGADVPVCPDDEDLLARVREATGGRGVDVAFEAVGIGPTVRQAIQITRPRGTVVLVGNVQPRVEIDLQDVIARELSLVGSYASSGEYREALELVHRGRLQVDPLISEIRPLAEGQAAFDRLYEGTEDLVKIVLTP
ncbi:MAG: galactitol-1-phosphate 5-dehydrogenase [Bacteroidetes bacterium]|nr:MAG: galactitol-1-phosphate 5-dehydrogenase [Bacteroidota bacterium]